MKSLIVIIYDGIANSVFESQVLQPLIRQKQQTPYLDIHIVSFEKQTTVGTPNINGINFHIFKKYPFVHHMALIPAIIKLRRFLTSFTDYQLLARGPFAGYIAHKSATSTCCSVTIQARGLVAEEYRYTIENSRLTLIQTYRYKQFLHLEKKVYALNKKHITFQAVSPALKNYLTKTFGTKKETISIAQHDIPSAIHTDQHIVKTQSIRTQLHVDQNKFVYCYNGSFKPWQCPHETIAFFKKQLIKDQHAFLLILTPDITLFKNALEHAHIKKEFYHICTVTQADLPVYIAAAQAGLLFRKPHIINTISRPTKALDYQAAGLHIIHNGTVEYVNNMPNTTLISPYDFKVLLANHKNTLNNQQ
ncbi:MAG: hypothetical protein WD055_00150 [Candidatus Dependentiae bacterium]